MNPPAEQPGSEDAGSNRRRHARYRFSAPISVHISDGPAIPAITLEISEKGLSAVLASPLEIGCTVQLEPVAAAAVTAQVRHKVGRVYGFEFLKITEEQTKKLQDVCRTLPLYPPNSMGI
jgi:hypothetical protein